ncbi:MAG: ChbG/HpnK family deacetylase [Syntrophobacteraceae bacterium]|nr:ChbG/HpnK family deacetylase [Syntrophobacteraceae bacterium]
MHKKLIINADDLGLTKGINLAVSECADAGLLRSATIMANGAAFDDAVKIFGNREEFGTGIHFVLTGLKPVAPVQKVAGLLGPDGLLPSGPLGLLEKIAADKSLRDALRHELFAQAEKVFDSGIKPTHFDSHKHVHIIPAVLDVMVEIAARFSVKWVREPFEPNGSWRFSPDLHNGFKANFFKQLAVARVSTLARPAFRSRVRGAGMKTAAGVYGISFTGLMNEAILKSLCGMLKPGLSELMTHPGVMDADLLGLKGRLVASRAEEKKLLVSPEIKGFFEKNAITLRHFGEVDSE